MAVHIGDVGRALSPMSPSGVVEVNGERLDARSDGPFVPAGTPVVVLRGDPTGYVVRGLDPGQPPPELPGRGAPIPRGEAQLTGAEVAEADRRERAGRRHRVLRTLRYGIIAAAALGGAAGLVSGVIGWSAGWSSVADPPGVAQLLGGSAAVGAAAGVALFFLTGVVGSVGGLLSEGEAGFAPDFFVIAVALAGAVVGFWWRFGAEGVGADALVGWSVVGALGAAVVAWVVSWLSGNLFEAAARV